jgi:gamma-glutamyltranspeptidase/glutathione hydrolase
MKSTLPSSGGCGWWLLLLVWAIQPGIGTGAGWGQSPVTGQNGVAATVHPLASAAAVQAMRDGGNAIDAAVAAALTLGVVDGHNSGIGGGCFMLVRLADHSIVAFDGREQAPSAATRDLYVRNGKAQPNLSQTGPLAVGVPGSLAVYDEALRRYGKLPLARHLNAAARLAEEGFPLGRDLARQMAGSSNEWKSFPATRAILLRGGQGAYGVGDTFTQPDLAKSYHAIAEKGVAWFYSGEYARRTDEWMKQQGGIVTADDFGGYQLKTRQPILITYRGHQILGFPPPSSGGVHVAQILNILDTFNLRAMGLGSADFIHVVTEAMKLAFADRAFWLGDPDFTPVPRGLVTRSYAERLARRIDLNKATPVPMHDTPPDATEHLFEKHTTHFSTADALGNWVACTATINTTFGSKVVIPGTGIFLNNQMDDFSIQPGTRNFFGLVGAEANAVAPRKRPLSSMSPTIVLKDGRPVLCVGAAGGPTIISQTLLAIVYTVDFGLPLGEALAQVRFHHQWQPDELRIERTVTSRVRRELSRRGHKIKLVDSIGATQAVGQGTQRKVLIGATDPRTEGIAAGY